MDLAASRAASPNEGREPWGARRHKGHFVGLDRSACSSTFRGAPLSFRAVGGGGVARTVPRRTIFIRDSSGDVLYSSQYEGIDAKRSAMRLAIDTAKRDAIRVSKRVVDGGPPGGARFP